MRAWRCAVYRDLAEAAEPALTGAGGPEWLDWLDEERDNTRAALTWAWEAGETETGLRLAAALWRFWHARSPLALLARARPSGRGPSLAGPIPGPRRGVCRGRRAG